MSMAKPIPKNARTPVDPPEEGVGGPNDHSRNEEIEKIKHGHIDRDKTGAPRGRDRANAGEETS